VLFAHGSGSSRLSPRNRYVAGEIVDGGLGTLLFDLLTAAEERRDRLDASLRFDIGLLSRRLADATCGCERKPGPHPSASVTSVPAPVPPPRSQRASSAR
jgi:hypothetical protein